MKDKEILRSSTLSVWGGETGRYWERATQVPVVHSVSFGYDDMDLWLKVGQGKAPGHIYSRNTNPTVAAFEDKVRLLEGASEIYPGLRVEIANGHTMAQQVIHIDAAEREGHALSNAHVVFVGDLIPTSAHLPLPYNMAYDNEPLETVREKEAFLKQAAAKGWVLWFYHDPFVVAATVTFNGKRYEKERVLIP